MMTKEDRKIFKEFTDRVHARFSDARVWRLLGQDHGITLPIKALAQKQDRF